MKTFQLNLSPAERLEIKRKHVKINQLAAFAPDELMPLLNVSEERAKEIGASIEFQSIPSVGPKFAQDLIRMGFNTIAQLKDKDPAKLVDSYELQIGAWADPCLEDQFRLVVYYANNPNSTKQWWNFTAERKTFRALHGYPQNRPKTAWYQLPAL